MEHIDTILNAASGPLDDEIEAKGAELEAGLDTEHLRLLEGLEELYVLRQITLASRAFEMGVEIGRVIGRSEPSLEHLPKAGGQ